jgi:ribosome-binding ATPase YchF (GTP1/OBG family)
MSVNIGIIGLAASGRTTLFNALVKGKVDTKSYTQEVAAPHLGVAKVPEPRLEALADILHPRRVVPAEVTYIDIDASVKSLVKDKTVGGQFLAQLSTVDTLINVVRAFADESIPHPEGSLDIERDITNMNLELAFSDLAILERRLERIDTSLKGAKQPERQVLLQEQETLIKIKADLEKDVPIRELGLAAAEARAIANFQFLTAKPLLVVVNIGEDQLPTYFAVGWLTGSHYTFP